VIASTAVDLARAQFATTSLYHFLFVPLTLGLGPIVATMQTLWLRTKNEAWLKLTKFFGTLFLINFGIGVATGLVQEFQFGMDWSVYSRFVGNVFGAPLAIEGLAAFFLEATFLGLWIFGWDRLSPRLHLATLWIAVLGTWMSAYFILVANSFMQDPVGYKLVNGEAQLTSVWKLLSSDWALWAFGHTMFAGLTAGSAVVFGVACWQLARGHNRELFMRAAKVALIFLVPFASINMWFGSHFGILVTQLQPMKISAAEALWTTQTPAAFSLFQIGGFTSSDPTPSFSIEVPGLLSYLSTGSFQGTVQGLDELNKQYERMYGRGNYEPPVEAIYWSMRGMAYAGSIVALVALVGGWLMWRRRLDQWRWFLWVGVVTTFLPFVACGFGWVLTEVGRQPWIVQGLLQTANAASPNVGTTYLAISLSIFVALYLALLVVDIWLMRRYAGGDLERVPKEEAPLPGRAVVVP
jgi:cytochrome d ubiquinol oxidase subunit I